MLYRWEVSESYMCSCVCAHLSFKHKTKGSVGFVLVECIKPSISETQWHILTRYSILRNCTWKCNFQWNRKKVYYNFVYHAPWKLQGRWYWIFSVSWKQQIIYDAGKIHLCSYSYITNRRKRHIYVHRDHRVVNWWSALEMYSSIRNKKTDTNALLVQQPQ